MARFRNADLSCNMHHKWCRMICASLCNWSLYFHWQLLYSKMWTVCKICEKCLCASLLWQWRVCKICEKSDRASFLSGDFHWRVLTAPDSCCLIGNSPGVIHIYCTTTLWHMHNHTKHCSERTSKISLLAPLWVYTTKPECIYVKLFHWTMFYAHDQTKQSSERRSKVFLSTNYSIYGASAIRQVHEKRIFFHSRFFDITAFALG